MKELFLLRHGEVDGYQHRYVGKTDVKLSRQGREELLQLARNFGDEQFETIYCSPLLRCRETLALLDRSEEVILDERIREVDFGLWEGKSYEEILSEYPELVAHWAAGSEDFCFPEGEKISQFNQRLADFACDLQKLRERKILIITHGGVIRHLICQFLRIPLSNYLYFKINHGRFALLQLYSEGGILTGLNTRNPHG